MVSDAETTATGTGKTAYAPLIRLSSGGMGYVELCVRREGRFQRLYAVKRLLPTVRHDEAAISMFVEEGRVGGLVQHPNVVSVLDVGSDERGPYLVMEYVSGVTVRELVAAAAKASEFLSIQLACNLAAQAARGLAAAHELRSHGGDELALVHRDVSPHNLLIGYDGVVQVADFGIARLLGRDHKTATGLLKGKLGYMSPEVLRFEKVTPASDLFSFGIVLFEMLTSSRLYGQGDDAKRARRILDELPPSLDTLRDDAPAELTDLLGQLLAKARKDRPASAREVADQLEGIANALALEEGKVDLAAHLQETFAEQRRDREAELQVALDAFAAQPKAEDPEGEEEAPIVVPVSAGWKVAGAAVAVVGLLLAGLLGGWAATSSEPARAASGVDTRRPVEAPEAAEPPPPSDDPPADPEDTPGPITLRLRSEPSGATVRGDGFEDVTTPTQITLPEGEDEVVLRFELDGHEPIEERIVPDENQLLRVQLSAVEPEPSSNRRGRRGRGRAAPVTPDPPSRGFGLFSD